MKVRRNWQTLRPVRFPLEKAEEYTRQEEKLGVHLESAVKGVLVWGLQFYKVVWVVNVMPKCRFANCHRKD